MKITREQRQLIVQALDKHEASNKRLISATTNEGVRELYQKELTEILKLKDLITTGQGALTL